MFTHMSTILGLILNISVLCLDACITSLVVPDILALGFHAVVSEIMGNNSMLLLHNETYIQPFVEL